MQCIYRDAWYRANAKDVIDAIAIYLSPQQGGDVLTDKSKDQSEPEPTSYASSPSEFKRMILSHQQCIVVKN